MVRHQHPGPDYDTSHRAILAEQIAIERMMRIAEKGLRTAVAALRHMVGMTREYRACHARHGLEVVTPHDRSN